MFGPLKYPCARPLNHECVFEHGAVGTHSVVVRGTLRKHLVGIWRDDFCDDDDDDDDDDGDDDDDDGGGCSGDGDGRGEVMMPALSKEDPVA